MQIVNKWLNFTSLEGGWHPFARVPAILGHPLEDNTALAHLKVDFMWHTCRILGMQVHIFDHAPHYVTAWTLTNQRWAIFIYFIYFHIFDHAHHYVTAWPLTNQRWAIFHTVHIGQYFLLLTEAQKKLLTSSPVSLGETWHNHLQIPLPGCQCQVTLIIFIPCQLTVCSGFRIHREGLVEVTGGVHVQNTSLDSSISFRF
jgi:hypothetical protein